MEDLHAAVQFLVNHAAKLDVDAQNTRSELASIRAEMATKQEVAALSEQIREGTRAMRNYTAYVENMLNIVTKGQLSLEDQVNGIRLHVDTLEQRVKDLEKRNPPQAA